MSDDAVNALPLPDMLSERVDAVVGLDKGLQRVDASVGIAGGMGRLAEELDLEAYQGQRSRTGSVHHVGVHYHSRIHTVEGTPFRQEHLSAVRLLGRGANHHDRSAEFVNGFAGSTPRPRSGSADDVVPAAMSDVGQGIVLGEQGNHRLARTVGSLEGRGQLANPPLNLKPVPLQVLGQPGGSLHLLEGHLRVLVNPQAELDQLRTQRIHLITDRRFQFLDVHSSPPRLPHDFLGSGPFAGNQPDPLPRRPRFAPHT